MPLIPGFEGQYGTPGGRAMEAITHWNYASINRGQYSILHRLKQSGILDPSEYIMFCSLRTYTEMNGKYVSTFF